MFKIIKPLMAGTALAAFCLLTPGLSHAQSTAYCYNHPYDNSQFCFCYHHPNECNGEYGSGYSGWNRGPDWNQGWDWNRADRGYGPYDRFSPNAGFVRDYPNHSSHFEQGRPDVRVERGRSDFRADAGHPNQGDGGHHYERN